MRKELLHKNIMDLFDTRANYRITPANSLFFNLMVLGMVSIMSACASKAQVAVNPVHIEALQGKEWLLVEIKTISGKHSFSRQELEAEDMGDCYTLQFDTDQLSGKAAPNRYTVSYTQPEDQHISLKTIASTRMFSFKEPSALKEHEYFRYLEQVSRWDLIAGMLELYAQDEYGQEVILVFGLRE